MVYSEGDSYTKVAREVGLHKLNRGFTTSITEQHK